MHFSKLIFRLVKKRISYYKKTQVLLEIVKYVKKIYQSEIL